MNVTILFFGATAYAVGERRIELSLTKNLTAKMVFDQVRQEFPNLGNHKLLYSLNQDYANGDEIVRDGDELAIFTAVSGG
ncbi:MAG: MoaD/ThiS family protein [Pyrinomonadaceae bacterium]